MERKSQIYTHIYWLINDGEIDSDLLFDFLELFWPTFKVIDGYVFLEGKYTDIEYEHLVAEEINPEFWINLLTIDDYFMYSADSVKQSIKFSEKLAEVWKAKLENDFPLKNFTVECLEDHQTGDYGLTFYQTKYEITN